MLRVDASHGESRCDLSVACPMYRLSMFRHYLAADALQRTSQNTDRCSHPNVCGSELLIQRRLQISPTGFYTSIYSLLSRLFFIIYFLLSICNSPLSPNYFGKIQLLLIISFRFHYLLSTYFTLIFLIQVLCYIFPVTFRNSSLSNLTYISFLLLSHVVLFHFNWLSSSWSFASFFHSFILNFCSFPLS